METTMFALGILATIMVMFIAVVVVGTVKVFKMNKQIKELYTYIHEIERHWSDRLNDTHRDINMVEGTLRNGMEHYERAVNDQITDSVTQSNSYTDRRIDKLIDTYFEVQEAKQQSKKLIKG
jgi:hypothetical protein